MLDLIHIRELSRSGDTETRIGDNDIYMIGMRQHLLHRFLRAGRIAYIAIDMRNMLPVNAVSTEFKNTPAPLCEERGCCFAYTGTTAGYYKNFSHWLLVILHLRRTFAQHTCDDLHRLINDRLRMSSHQRRTQ